MIIPAVGVIISQEHHHLRPLRKFLQPVDRFHQVTLFIQRIRITGVAVLICRSFQETDGRQNPGFGRALALYRGPGDWVVIDVPTMGTGKQRELDGATLAAWLREHRPVKAFIEYTAALPGQGVSSMFRYGGMSWGLKAALAAFAVPCVEVTAATWKRAAGIAPGSDKERSRQMALQRWPDQAKYLGRKRNHGRAEAMLIAAYGAGTLKHGAGHESAEADTAADAAH